jgi:hypothetical protein
MKWEDEFKEGKEIVLATCSNNSCPLANIVVSLGFVEDKLLIANCQMRRTFENLLTTKKACLVSGHFRIEGKVKLFDKGKYFDLAQQKTEDYIVKSVILVEIEKVFDLDGVKEVPI